MAKEESVPKAMRPRYDEIATLIDNFCGQHLNEEYAQVCRSMTAKLARKRPSPLVSGRAETWAAGIIHAIGQVNFLFDKTQTPHVKSPLIAESFGIAKSTVTSKAAEIKRIFNIHLMDPNWTLPGRMGSNPMAWYITVNGFMMDARHAPSDIQVAAYQKGLIPYIPFLQNKGEE
jgi:hypothetical protein